jgi:uracil-DNA glycosylase family protein
VGKVSAAPFIPQHARLRELAAAAADCRGCELFEDATQTVFGQGPARAAAMFVGEQPGDIEDRKGEPFVGPAGRMLDRAFGDAGIDRRAVYLTNAVKHFRWKSTARSNRRIHARPETRHIVACQPWLAAEIAAVRPRVVVALGAVAAQSLFGSAFRLTKHRGESLDWPPERGPFADDASPVQTAFATVHPSAVLRAERDDRSEVYADLVRDLTVVADRLSSLTA